MLHRAPRPCAKLTAGADKCSHLGIETAQYSAEHAQSSSLAGDIESRAALRQPGVSVEIEALEGTLRIGKPSRDKTTARPEPNHLACSVHHSMCGLWVQPLEHVGFACQP